MNKLLIVFTLCISNLFLLYSSYAKDRDVVNAQRICTEVVSKHSSYIDLEDICSEINPNNTWASSNTGYLNINCTERNGAIFCVKKGEGEGEGALLTIISVENSGSIVNRGDSEAGAVLINTK